MLIEVLIALGSVRTYLPFTWLMVHLLPARTIRVMKDTTGNGAGSYFG